MPKSVYSPIVDCRAKGLDFGKWRGWKDVEKNEVIIEIEDVIKKNSKSLNEIDFIKIINFVNALRCSNAMKKGIYIPYNPLKEHGYYG